MQSAELASNVRSPSPTPTPTPTVSLYDGTYLPLYTLCSPTSPCITGLVLYMGGFQANMSFQGIPMTQKGTYIYDSMNGIIFTQQSLTMTPGTGQASGMSCMGATLTDNIETDVSGLTCNSVLMTSDRAVIMPDLMLTSSTAFTNCSTGLFTIPCRFNTYYSLVLQTSETSGAPATLGDGDYTAPTADVSTAGLTLGLVSPNNVTTSLDKIAVAGSNLTLTTTVYNSNTAIATLTSTGTFAVDGNGYMTFTQTAQSLLPATGGARVLNSLCNGGTFADGVSASVEGFTCTEASCGSGLSCEYFEVSANGSYGLNLTNVDASTISPCPSGYKNCQYDAAYSYVR